MKKIKCKKCGLFYKDRGEDDFLTGTKYVRELCWNCGFVWQCLGACLQGIGAQRSNREIIVKLDDVIIRKRRTLKE